MPKKQTKSYKTPMEMNNIHPSMRGYFSYYLKQGMGMDPNIWLITADLGYKMFDEIREMFPDRFINTGAAELSAIDIAVGLALSGKIPVVYSITPFLLSRGHEAIRLYMDHEQIPVKLIGSGRDKDYKHDGFSHDASDASEILSTFKNVTEYWPTTKEEMGWLVKEVIYNQRPTFVSLRR